MSDKLSFFSNEPRFPALVQRVFRETL